MSVIHLDEVRRRQAQQCSLYEELLNDLGGKISYRHSMATSQTLTQQPVFVGLRKHDVRPTDDTLKKLVGASVKNYRILKATSGEVNIPGVHFTLRLLSPS